MKIALVGVGLIGGSFVLGLRRRMPTLHVIGVDQNADNLKQAKHLGIIDAQASLEGAIKETDCTILAIPVDAIVNLLPRVLDLANADHTVIDFGSTKAAICEAVKDHPNRACFVAAHPIAGTEYSGPKAAFAELFDHKVMITCESEKSGTKQLTLYDQFCSAMQMQMREMSPESHDLHMAFVSHLSHITSFALSKAVLKKEETDEHILDMAGSGFASTVRLAKSSPEMWAPIFKHNQKNLLDGLSTYIEELEQFKELLKNQDEEGMTAFMKEANKIREIVDRIK
jgi:prephenate dehydrogenase